VKENWSFYTLDFGFVDVQKMEVISMIRSIPPYGSIPKHRRDDGGGDQAASAGAGYGEA